MKYWSIKDTLVRHVVEGESRIPENFPAAMGKLTVAGAIWGYYEVEIIPGTLRKGTYVSPSSFDTVEDMVVDARYARKKMGETEWLTATYTHPISAFKLTSIPIQRGAHDAYDRAMKGI